MGHLAKTPTLPIAEDLLHDLRNGLAGVHGAIRIVRDGMHESTEREILSIVVGRLERLSVRLLEESAPSDDMARPNIVD
jgi:nitrogen-specific signal transduction histidine kinase